MKSTSRLRAFVASAAALATIAAGLALVTAAPANAAATNGANAARLTASDTSPRAAAGTCVPITFTPVDQFGTTSTRPDTVTVLLQESPSSPTQDADFCSTDSSLPSFGPVYTNGDDDGDSVVFGGEVMSYNVGPGITNNNFNAGGSPDVASDAAESDGNLPNCCARNNPEGQDRARYSYVPGEPAPKIGVVSLTPGSVTLQAFFDEGADDDPVFGYRPNNFRLNPIETRAPLVTFTFSAGGLPGSSEAAAAVSAITLDPRDDTGAPGARQNFTATLRNGAGDTVRGVTPSVSVAANGPNASATPTCDMSDNQGISRCSFTGIQAGTDVITVYVNRAGGTSGLESGEISATGTRTTTRPAVAASFARFIDLTPDGTTIPAGGSAVLTATVTSATGAPAQGVLVDIVESGAGAFTAGASSVRGTTDNTGRVQVTDFASGETGTQSVRASIASLGTDCEQPAGTGTDATGSTPAGRCDDFITNRVGTSPSPSPTQSASASPSATNTATTTPSNTMTASSTPTPPPCRIAAVTVNTPTINATGLASVTVTGARPNSRVELQGYSQDHFLTQNFSNDPTPVDRSGIAGNDGSITFNDLRPASNTRVRARQEGCAYGDSAVIDVRAQETLQVTRTGTRAYTFSGRSIPARPGGLIVSLYRIVGTPCAAGVEPRNCPGEAFIGQGRARALGTAGEGLYSIRITFPSGDENVRDEFVVKTGRDAQNAPGRSNVRSLLIF